MARELSHIEIAPEHFDVVVSLILPFTNLKWLEKHGFEKNFPSIRRLLSKIPGILAFLFVTLPGLMLVSLLIRVVPSNTFLDIFSEWQTRFFTISVFMLSITILCGFLIKTMLDGKEKYKLNLGLQVCHMETKLGKFLKSIKGKTKIPTRLAIIMSFVATWSEVYAPCAIAIGMILLILHNYVTIQFVMKLQVTKKTKSVEIEYIHKELDSGAVHANILRFLKGCIELNGSWENQEETSDDSESNTIKERNDDDVGNLFNAKKIRPLGYFVYFSLNVEMKSDSMQPVCNWLSTMNAGYTACLVFFEFESETMLLPYVPFILFCMTLVRCKAPLKQPFTESNIGTVIYQVLVVGFYALVFVMFLVTLKDVEKVVNFFNMNCGTITHKIKQIILVHIQERNQPSFLHQYMPVVFTDFMDKHKHVFAFMESFFSGGWMAFMMFQTPSSLSWIPSSLSWIF